MKKLSMEMWGNLCRCISAVEFGLKNRQEYQILLVVRRILDQLSYLG
jgi:hypothetical protein